MAFAFTQGSFVANTATGNQTIDTGSGETMKALILYGTLQTASGFAAGCYGFVGYCVSATQRYCMSWAMDDAQTSTQNGSGMHALAINLFDDGTTPTINGSADFVDFTTGGAGRFTINWTNAPTSAWIIHYVCVGGTDITNAFVGQYAAKLTPTGNRDDTGVGFQGDLVLFAGVAQTATGVSANTHCFMGAAKSSSLRYTNFIGGRDARTTTTEQKTWQDATKCLA